MKLLKWLGILIVLLVVAGGVLYFLIQSGRVSLFALSNMLSATGDITIVNLDRETVSAKLVPTDPDAEGGTQSVKVERYDIGGFGSVMAGEYTLSLTPGGECTMEIKRGDVYTLVAVPRGVAIARDGYEPDDPDELDIATSSLCR